MAVEINELGLRCGLAPRPMPQGTASIAALVDALPRTGEPALIDRDSLAVGGGQWAAGARRGTGISLTIMNLVVHGPVLTLAAGGCIVLMDR